MPCSAIVYLRRAWRRFVRSPQSRWTTTTASAIAQLVARLDEPERVREPRVRLGLAVGAPQAAADVDVPALELAARREHAGEPEVVGEQVDRVVAADGHAGLELARQVGPAVHRLLLDGRAVRRPDPGELLAVEPQLGVGAGARQEVLRDAQRHLARRGVARVRDGQRRGHHVAVDVAAGAERGRQGVVDRPDDGPDVALGDEVELDALAGREPDRRPAEPRGEVVERQPQRRAGCRRPRPGAGS